MPRAPQTECSTLQGRSVRTSGFTWAKISRCIELGCRRTTDLAIHEHGLNGHEWSRKLPQNCQHALNATRPPLQPDCVLRATCECPRTGV